MRRHLEFLIASVLLSACFSSLHADGVLFAKENIEVTILSLSSIQVRGEYYFTSTGSETSYSNLFYPFPLDSSSAYPCSISVGNIKGPDVPFTRSEKGIYFPVKVESGDTTGILVVYRQNVKNHRGTYILTTTHYWESPLQNSNYSVRVPGSYILDYLSYECDSVSVKDNYIVYQFFRKKFMPDMDLSFTWSWGSNDKGSRTRKRINRVRKMDTNASDRTSKITNR